MREVSYAHPPHDSQIVILGNIQNDLLRKYGGRPTNLDAFQTEYRDRCREEAGLEVKIHPRYSLRPGEYAFSIDIVGSYWKFDPDRQVHEVTRDIIGEGHEGVIRTGHKTPGVF